MAKPTPSRPLAHDLSPEVVHYLETRGYGLPTIVPRVRTREPRNVKGAVFDVAEVDRKIAALGHLRHTKGKWAGRPIVPTAAQVAYIIAPIFGWRRKVDGRMVRIIREAWIEMPRKGAKTTLAAALLFLLAFADDEGGAEVLLAAASKDQANQSFKPLSAVAKASRVLTDAGIRALRSEIVRDSDGSFVKVVSSRGDLAHGANVHGGLIDELHVHKSPDLLEAIESGTGARDQPLVVVITTADDGRTTTVYAARRDLIEKVAKGTLKAPAIYGVVFAADDGDDPHSEATWIKANPLYPTTPTREFMQAASDKARANGAELASFLRLHLGVRAKLASAYIDMERWDRNGSIVDPAALRGRTAYGGLDLGSVSDLTALVWLFPKGGGYDVLARFWMPEAALPALDVATARNASTWVKEGWISLTPGDVTDYDFIKAQIATDVDAFDVKGVGFDPWNATQTVNDLQAEGVPMERVRQGFFSLSGPMKELDRLVRTGTSERPLVRHGGNPVLRWMADNLRPAVDASGNVKPDKAKSMSKIDGMSALVTGLAVAMAAPVEQEAPPPVMPRTVGRTAKRSGIATAGF